jgi:hypothetical protein
LLARGATNPVESDGASSAILVPAQAICSDATVRNPFSFVFARCRSNTTANTELWLTALHRDLRQDELGDALTVITAEGAGVGNHQSSFWEVVRRRNHQSSFLRLPRPLESAGVPFFTGTIQEIRVYDRALSQADIAALRDFRP